MAQVRVAEDELQRMFTVMKENVIDCGTAGFTDFFFYLFLDNNGAPWRKGNADKSSWPAQESSLE